MPSPLLLDLTGAPEASWRAALAGSGLHLELACASHNLVHRTSTEAPTLLVCLAPRLDAALAMALAPWNGCPPCACLLLTPPTPFDAAAAQRGVELGIHHWEALAAPADATAATRAVDAAAAQAQARWRREQALRQALARAEAQLDERKWVDRAKGVLMAARGMAEDEAFKLLRGTAMNVNLRVGEVSRAVFESARWAEAMNRAGQLRMLSQRLVRLVAQRLLKIDARAAVALGRAATQRMQDNLDALARQCAGSLAQAACVQTLQCWLALAQALSAARVDLPALALIDHRAGALLDAAERLTEALQEAAGRRALSVVNECGRQRMRVQRVAKDSLLAALHIGADDEPGLATRRDAVLDEFERVQRELERLPLNSPQIRAAQAEVRDEWLRLLGGLRAGDPADGRRALVHASDLLLDRLDALTAAYEHSLQVIMG